MRRFLGLSCLGQVVAFASGAPPVFFVPAAPAASQPAVELSAGEGCGAADACPAGWQRDWSNASVAPGRRCTQELWHGGWNMARRDAQRFCEQDSFCLGLQWYKKGSGGKDGRFALNGGYQGCGGFVASQTNSEWDVIFKPDCMPVELSAGATDACPAGWQRDWSNASVVPGRRCTEELWHGGWNMARRDAQRLCEQDSACLGLQWYQKGSEGKDGRFALNGGYQGCGGFVASQTKSDWDVILKPDCMPVEAEGATASGGGVGGGATTASVQQPMLAQENESTRVFVLPELPSLSAEGGRGSLPEFLGPTIGRKMR